MTIVSLRLAPGDTTAHPITADKTMAIFAALWPDDGSGVVRFGDSAGQAGFAPFQFGSIPGGGGAQPVFDLSKIYYKLTANGDALCVVYAIP